MSEACHPIAQFRQCTPSDHDGLADCLRDETLQRQWLGAIVRADELNRYLIDMTRHRSWVEHRIVAFVATVGAGAHIAAAARIDGISLSYFVVEPLRRQGIGSALVRHVMAALSHAGVQELSACVAPDNTASRRLLLRCGFREVEHAAFITTPGGVPQTLVVHAAGLKGTSP